MGVEQPDALKHYGVKGMKWGVIRERVQSGAKPAAKAAGKGTVAVAKELYKPSTDAVEARKFQVKAKFGGVKSMTNAEMRKVIARMELEHRYRDLYGEHQYHDEGVSFLKRFAMKGARWAGRFTEDVSKDVVVSWVGNPFGGARSSTDPKRAQAWTYGKQFSDAIESGPKRKAIGR